MLYGLIGFWLGGYVVSFVGASISRRAGMAGLENITTWRIAVFCLLWPFTVVTSYWKLRNRIRQVRLANLQPNARARRGEKLARRLH